MLCTATRGISRPLYLHRLLSSISHLEFAWSVLSPVRLTCFSREPQCGSILTHSQNESQVAEGKVVLLDHPSSGSLRSDSDGNLWPNKLSGVLAHLTLMKTIYMRIYVRFPRTSGRTIKTIKPKYVSRTRVYYDGVA